MPGDLVGDTDSDTCLLGIFPPLYYDITLLPWGSLQSYTSLGYAVTTAALLITPVWAAL